MIKDTYKTKVIFRVDERDGGREVLAVFPELAGDSNALRTCLCYAHLGQHGAASVDIAHWTRKASPQEYSDLKAELESIGYDLRIAYRFTRADYIKRRDAIKEQLQIVDEVMDEIIKEENGQL